MFKKTPLKIPLFKKLVTANFTYIKKKKVSLKKKLLKIEPIRPFM
jgi:hypothetical protein